MKNKELIPVEAVYERDIDLLLLEEFSINFEFRKWVLESNDFPVEDDFNGVWRSISDFSLGETDILFSYTSNGQKIYLLIENKLDSEFQQNQGLRYQNRGEKYVNTNECNSFYTLLIAPRDYLKVQSDFESTLQYEDIRDWFRSKKDPRMNFKSKVLDIAIEKLRRGYQPMNDERAQKFWIKYWESLTNLSTDLEMKKPHIVPVESDWPLLTNNNLKQLNFKIIHKLSRGFIDAQCSNKEIQDKLNSIILPKQYTIVKTGKSTSIRVKTHVLDRLKDFFEQENLVIESIKKAIELNNWIIENKSQLS